VRFSPVCWDRAPPSGGPGRQADNGSGGRHDNYGFALTAQPGESQRQPATNTSSQLIEYIGLPAPSCSRRLCPGWSHHTPRSRGLQPSIGARHHHTGYQRHRIFEREIASRRVRPRAFSDRRKRHETAVSRVEPGAKRMDNAATRMGDGESPVRHPVPGSVQAGMTQKPDFTRKFRHSPAPERKSSAMGASPFDFRTALRPLASSIIRRSSSARRPLRRRALA